MPQTSENNKRIAKNTLLLYMRMLFMMAVSLFTSRITLAALGVTDYGIYNVVGGMVAMFSILSGSLSVTIGRFITVEVGKGDKERLKTIFSTSVSIQICMALVICLIAEVAGVWFLNNKMVIPVDRLYAAHWVLQLSILTFLVNLISVPYNAVIIAHERMSAFAYISILEVVLKLVIVYLLYVSPVDKLIVYAVLLALVAVVIRLVYGSYCKRHFDEAHYRFCFDKNLLRDMFGFIGWAFWGNAMVVLKDQGTNVLLNLFCGPAVNAARGVAMQVNNAVYSFVQNFMMAVNPQITKSYSAGNVNDMHKLIIRSAKFGFFILLMLLMPICANIDYILGLWLVEVPEHTANFIVLVLLYSLLDCYGHPLITGVLAEGDIKRYEIALTIIYFLNFIASYVFLKLGMQPEVVFVLNIIFKAFVIIALLWHSHAKYSLPVNEFMIKCVLRTVVIFLINASLVYLLPISDCNNLLDFATSSLMIFTVCAALVYFIGITKNEAAYIKNMVASKLHLKHRNKK